MMEFGKFCLIHNFFLFVAFFLQLYKGHENRFKKLISRKFAFAREVKSFAMQRKMIFFHVGAECAMDKKYLYKNKTLFEEKPFSFLDSLEMDLQTTTTTNNNKVESFELRG